MSITIKSRQPLMFVYGKLHKRVGKLLTPAKKASVFETVLKAKKSFYYDDERKTFENSMLEHRAEMVKFDLTRFI